MGRGIFECTIDWGTEVPPARLGLDAAVLSGAAERTAGRFWRLRGVPRTHAHVLQICCLL